MLFGVLGPIEVRRDGVRVDISAARPRAVLAALLVDPGAVVGVDTLLSRVWADDPNAKAAGVQTLISRLRRLLEPDGTAGHWQLITTEPPGYRLTTAPEDIDAVNFTRLLRTAQSQAVAGSLSAARNDVAEALRLWRGEPYADVSAAFARDEADRLAELRLTAIELGAELDLSLGRETSILAELPELVRAEPLREGLRSSLMLALYRAGRQADALAVYADLRTRLAAGLGVDPHRDLTTLYQRILRQDPRLDSTAGERRVLPASTTSLGRRSLVGREQELAVLQHNHRESLADRPRTVVITGEAGIGKSRLVEEFAEPLRGRGIAVVWGRCWDHEGAPALWPWAQALRALRGAYAPDQLRAALSERGSEAARLLPETGTETAQEAGPQPTPGEARILLYDAVTAFLETLGRERPLVVVLEDLHWSDAESARLLEYVTTTLAASQVLVVVTLRVPSDSRATPADELLPGLSRTDRSDRITLAGLSVDDVRAYLTGAVGRPVDEATASAVHARTDGNPFFLTEVARVFGGAAEPSRSEATRTIPQTVLEMIAHRLQPLPQEVRALLAVASVAGRSFDLALLSTVTGLTDEQVERGVQIAADIGLLDSDPDFSSRYRFAHALVQETLLHQTMSVRRARLHARVASVLESRYAPDQDSHAAELAHHWSEAGTAGDPEKASRYHLLAAAQAQARWSFGDAEEHLRAALGLAAGIDGQAGRELELRSRVQLGSLLSLTLGYNDAAVAQERARSLTLCRAGYGTDDDLLSALYGTWGVALVSGDFATAGELAEEMAGAAEQRGNPVMALAAHQSIGQVRWHQGRLTEAMAAIDLAIPLADNNSAQIRLDLFLQHPAASARGWKAAILAIQGDVAGSDAAAEAARVTAADVGDPFTSTFVEILDGWRHVWLHRPADALRCGSAGVGRADRHGFALLIGYGLPVLGWGQAMAGDVDGGVASVRTAIDAFRALPGGHMFGHLMQWVLADCLRAGNSPDDALTALDDAVAESDWTGERFLRSEIHRLRHDLLRRHEPDRAADELAIAVRVASEQGAELFAKRARDSVRPDLPAD